MAANPNLIGGGRMTRSETSGDKRRFEGKKLDLPVLLRRLWNYIGRNRYLLLLALFLSSASSFLALLGPKLSGRAINAIEPGAGHVDLHTVWHCFIWMIVCYTCSSLLTAFLNVVMIRMSRGISRQMRHDVFENLTRLPVGYFDRYQTGDIISTITYDIDTVNQSLSTDLLQILQSSLTIVVSFVMMLTIAPQLVTIFAFTIPCTLFFTRWLTRRVRPLFRRRSAQLGALNGFVEEKLSGQKSIRAYGREDAVLELFDEKNRSAVQAYTVAEANGTITGPAVNFINNASLALLCAFGSLLFLTGELRLGDLSSFVQYSRKFSGPINEIANIIAELQSALAAAERVFTLIDAQPEPEDPKDAQILTDVEGDVEFSHVAFSYEPERPIVQDLSFRAKPGTLTAIVGPTGTGKTTIINLLMRFYDVDEGNIYIDGKELRTLTRDSLRKAFTMVLQDTWLFHGTIYENIAYGKPDATMDEVIAAAKASHIHSYISRLPQGYQTILSDNGTSISKGQKQMLTIARAMLLNAPMLILDEATSNVDTRTEEHIQAAMRELMKDRTCFVIAHRLSTIRSADQILVLDGGRIAEQGSHESLMASGGIYRRLYEAQFDALSG